MRIRILLFSMFLLSFHSCGMATTQTTTLPITTLTTLDTVATTGEATTTALLPRPDGLELDEDELLTWNVFSPDATYVVEIDGVEHAVTGASFDMSSYPDAVYLVRVKMILGVRQSDYSDDYTFTIRNHPEIPWNLRIEEIALRWDEPDGAIGYRLDINGETIDVPSPWFYLDGMELNALFTFTVRALYEGEIVSAPAAPFYYHTYHVSVGSASVSYNKNAPADAVSDFSEETWTFEGVLCEGVPVPETDYAFTGGFLTLMEGFLSEFPYGAYEYLVLTSEGSLTLSLQVVDDRQPYMISSNQITFTGSDIVLTFEVYDGMVVGLSGNDIAATDYLIDGNTVTISAVYVALKFAENPERTVLILGYNVSANDYVSIGYVFIRLPA